MASQADTGGKERVNTQGSSTSDGKLPEPPERVSGFRKLPAELRQGILFAACGAPVIKRFNIVGCSGDCTETMLALLTTCKAFYRIIAPMLYRRIRVTKPSVLRQLQQTLSARPSLGRIMTALHVGPDQALPRDWWPIREARPFWKTFKLRLAATTSSCRAPWKTCEVLEFGLREGRAGEESNGRALREALEAASKDLNVHVHDDREQGEWFYGSDRWHLRVLEAQAAVELYALEMRRLDSRAKADEGEEGRKTKKRKMVYPALRIEPSASPPSSHTASEDTFVVTRAQIIERMSSAGSPTDLFDHPALFAPSKLPWYARDHHDKLHSGNVRAGNLDAWDDIPDVFGAQHSIASPPEEWTTPFDDYWSLLHLSRFSTFTASGCLAIARSLMSLTRDIKTLSLTGIFTGLMECEGPSQIPFVLGVSLGPPSPGWDEKIVLDYSHIVGLKELRVCDVPLSERAVARLAGNTSCLQELKYFEWSMRGRYTPHEAYPGAHAPSIDQIVRQLVGLDPPSATFYSDLRSATGDSSNRRRRQERRTPEAEDITLLPSPEERSPGIHMEIALHPQDVERVLDSAPSEAVAKAWRTGEDVPGQRNTLKLIAHTCYNKSNEREDQTAKATQEYYDDGRRWWEGE